MSVQYSNSQIVTNGLFMSLNAADANCYKSGGGTDWIDLARPGLTGSLKNGVGYSTSNGGYFIFDGIDDWAQQPGYTLAGGNQITLEVWAYQTVGSKSSNMIVYDGNSGARMRIDSSNVFWALAGNGGTFTLLTTSFTLSLNTWYHLVASIATNAFFLYVNGVQSASNTAMTFNPTNATNYDLTIGGQTFGEWLTGRIAVARAYSRNLSAAEVLQNFNAERLRFGV